MNFGTETPILLAWGIGGIALTGLLATIWAGRGISNETNTLGYGATRLRDTLPSLDLSEASPDEWMLEQGLEADSHFGDCLIAVWAGWQAGRLPTLGELHTLSVRRERRRTSARVATGVTGLLVVTGIAFTLLSIHPILGEFQLLSNPSGEASANTASAVKMIKDLGNAFWPSMAALIATVLMAAVRGVLYVKPASDLAWKLDRFALKDLFPQFRPRTLRDDFEEMHLKMHDLVTGLRKRDNNISELVAKLTGAAEEISEATPLLSKAAAAVAETSASMTSNAKALRTAFDKHLGGDSAVVRGLASLASIGECNQSAATSLSEAGRVITESAAKMTQVASKAGQQIEDTLAALPARVKAGCASGANMLTEASRSAAESASAEIIRTTTASVASMQMSIASIPEAVASSAEAAAEIVVKGTRAAVAETAATLRGETDQLKELTQGIGSLHRSLQTDVETVRLEIAGVGNAIQSAAENAGASVFGAARKALELNETALRDEVERIRVTVGEIQSSNQTLQAEARQVIEDAVSQVERAATDAVEQALTRNAAVAKEALQPADIINDGDEANEKPNPSYWFGKSFWRR